MFCDLADSTEVTAKLDAEEWRELDRNRVDWWARST
jgi:class 3 adenylate cyclase